MKTLLLLSSLAGLAAAQEAAAPAPEAEVQEAPAAPATEPAPPEASPAPAVEKAAEAPAAPAVEMEAGATGPDEEWAFVKASAEEPDGAIAEASMEDLKLFARRHPESAQAPEAMLLLAGLQQKKGEWQSALSVYLRLLYEFPANKTVLRAKSSYLELVEKKASRKQRPLLGELVRLPELPDKADRLSALWRKVADQLGETLYEPAAEEIRDFSVRFPGHRDGDKLLAALARLHGANGKAAAALLSWRKLLALHPASPLRAQAQMAAGDLYADALKDPRRAIDAYQDLVERHPKSPEVLGALERSAQLFEAKLRQYDLAVEMNEKIVALFPKTAASLKALQSIARLQRDRLSKPGEAAETLVRLSQMHGGQEGAEALYEAAGICEDELKDAAKAISLYGEVSSLYSSHKLAKKAADRAAKLGAGR